MNDGSDVIKKRKVGENKYNSDGIIPFPSTANTKRTSLCASNEPGFRAFVSRPINQTLKVVSNHLYIFKTVFYRKCFFFFSFPEKATAVLSGCNPAECEALTRSGSL